MPLSRRAFTMIEMLITIGLIFLLATLIIVALRGVRSQANRVVSANALRQMSLAYNSYCTDNKQQLMPGYVSAERLEQLGINPDLPSGKPFDELYDVSSYVWRLAPYLAYDWRVMYTDYRAPNLISKLNVEFEHGIYGPGSADWEASPAAEIGISLVPSFGLNSILLGGDDVHGGNTLTDLNPWDNPGGKIAATRFAEVRNPSTLVLFAPSVHYGERDDDPANDLFDYEENPPLAHVDLYFGYVELRPPLIPKLGGLDDELPQWHIESNRIIADGDFDAMDDDERHIGGGWPVARWDQSKLPVAHLDGSVTTEDINNLASDWTKWSPWSVGFNR
jgi:type II secretory pathway pseudopilin PulG